MSRHAELAPAGGQLGAPAQASAPCRPRGLGVGHLAGEASRGLGSC